MKMLLMLTVGALLLGSCASDSDIATAGVASAFVYDVDSGDEYARELGLNVLACDGDYEVELTESHDVLVVRVLNHAPSDGDCRDSFTVHTERPPSGKPVVDLTTGVAIEVETVARP